MSLAKRISSSVRLYHATRESRRRKELNLAETRRRKLAAKLGRDVKGWWTKLEKVVAYRQKLHADEERRAAMNKQLVVLVRQTEKYTESLATWTTTADQDDDDDEDLEEDKDSTSDDDPSGGGRRNSSEKRGQHHRMTIEEALASGRSRKTKSRVIDYSRMKLEATDFYGESTASDVSGSEDASFSAPDSDEESDDDDSTLREAIEDELRSRMRDKRRPGRPGGGGGGGGAARRGTTTAGTFFADPEELRKLREEGGMDIADVIERLKDEGEEDDGQEDGDDGSGTAQQFDSGGPSPPLGRRKPSHRIAKRVQFAEPNTEETGSKFSSSAIGRQTQQRPQVDPGEEADDDGDASDVEDYTALVSNDDNGVNDDGRLVDEDSDEFEVGEPELDDETTIAKEESLPQEMSVQEEIDLLKSEADMSIEELRKKYSDLVPNQNDDMKDSDGDASDAEEYAALLVDQNINGVNDDGRGDDDSDEFEVGEPELDDETTIEKEESLPQEMSVQEEINLLRSEADMSIEELRKKYSGLAANEKDDDVEQDGEEEDEENGEEEEDEEEEYELSAVPEVDDETTIEAEEKMGRDMSYEEELDMLKNDNEMSIEELRTMYAQLNGDDVATKAMDDDDDEESDQNDIPEADDTEDSSKRKREDENESELSRQEKKRHGRETNSESDDGAAALTALEASAESARTTVASRPFLLAGWVKMREYQQIGLNWLVSLQTRRLNGILADGG